MSKTAVEWLQVQIKNCPTAENLMNNIDGFLMEAKEMEKQQIIDAFEDGYGAVYRGWSGITGSEYYNETYKNK